MEILQPQHSNGYRQISNISLTKYQNLNVSRLALQLSLSNPLKPGVTSRIRMKLEQRRLTMLQLHVSDQHFYCILSYGYIRSLTALASPNIFSNLILCLVITLILALTLILAISDFLAMKYSRFVTVDRFAFETNHLRPFLTFPQRILVPSEYRMYWYDI